MMDLSIALILVGILLIPAHFLWLLFVRWCRLQVPHNRIMLAERSAGTDVGSAAPEGTARHLDDVHGQAGLRPAGPDSYPTV